MANQTTTLQEKNQRLKKLKVRKALEKTTEFDSEIEELERLIDQINYGK